MENHYQVLDVDVDATEAEVHCAYRESVRRCHPDVNPGDREALRRFHRVQAAFEVLADPQRRAAYDPNEAPSVEPAGPEPRPAKPGRRTHLEGVIFQRSVWFAHTRKADSAMVDNHTALAGVKIGAAVSMVLGYVGTALFFWYATGFTMPGN